MLVLFLFLGLKLHSNYDLRTQETNGGIKETIQTENQLKSKISKMTPKKKEGGRYNCNTIKFSYPKEMNLQEGKQFLLETDTDYEAFLKCENAKYNPNQNNVEIEGTIMNSGTKHILDRNPDALIIIKNADFKCSSSAFQASTSSNNDAQIIHFMGEGVHTITNTDFKLSGKNAYRFLKEDEHLLEEIDPTLIVFDDSSMNTIQGGQFSNPENETPARFIRTKKTSTLIVSGTDFYNATSIHRGSFLLLESSGESSIVNCRFVSGYDKDNCAHGIFANQGEVKILQCNFDKVLKDSSSEGSIILSETKRFEFQENSIKFNNPIINCRFLYLPNTGTYNIRRNNFQNLELKDKGNAIYIETPSELLFENNEFENIKGNTKIHGLHLTINNLGERPFIDNKFKNIATADGFLYIKAEDILNNITFYKWEFNNVGQNGGGIINVDNSNNNPYILIFTECSFYDNSNTNGGCLLINDQTFPNCHGLTMEECQGHMNRATGKGSVIAAFFDGDININGGDFNQNTADEGAVFYIEHTSNSKRKCIISNVHFNEDHGRESHCIWVNVGQSFNDDYTLEISDCEFAHNHAENYDGGTCCLSNCKETKVYSSTFHAWHSHIPYQSGGINVTAKGILEVEGCQFIRCNAGSIEGSYGGGIGYSYLKTGTSDRDREEKILIRDCEFNEGTGTNGVALLLNVLTVNVNISDVQILNHRNTNYIFCIFFNCEADTETFTLTRANFTGNSYDSKSHDGDCGGSGIWIAEARSQDYLQSLTVVFDHCTFHDNHSPVSGGAFGYDSSERLKAVELEFNDCTFTQNSCENSGGACHFATKKTVILQRCHFIDNNAQSSHSITGGGAIEFYASVELATIVDCEFNNCTSLKGSFIYTNGAVRGFDVHNCIFENLVGDHNSSVHLDVDSSAKTFIFENNDFINLECKGEYGGSGLHIGTGRDCEITSCTFKGNKGEGQIVVPEDSSKKLIFVRCEFKKDTGSRALFVKGEAPIEFDTCTFDDFDERTEENGRGLLVYSKAKKDAFFNNCTFTNIHFYSALDFEFSLKVEISWCNFTIVEACQSDVGGILYITKALEFSLTNCKFNTSGTIHGINNPCIKLCPSIDLAYIINCTFIKCGRYSNGGAVNAQNITELQIFNSTFQENMAQGDRGNTLSVYVDEDTKNCEISNCQIHTRRDSQKQNIFQFRVFAKQVTLTNSIFDKLNEDQISENEGGFGGIYFSSVENLIISHNIFETRNTAVKIENSGEVNAYNNTWQKCYGQKGTGARAFYIKTTNKTLVFRNNTVKNNIINNPNNNDNHIMEFSAKEIIIEDCVFSENRYSQPVGGGIGMRFDCTDFTVTFRECVFKQNTGGKGGALQFGGALEGQDQKENKGKLEIYDCQFEGNTADSTGGALSFTSQKENIIYNCIFKKNRATRNGGTISLISSNRENEYVSADESLSTNSIINCQFIESDSDKDVLSIYIMNKGKSIIEGCTFQNFELGGAGSQVVSQRKSNWGEAEGLVEFTNTTFEAINRCRGIEMREYGISKITKCTFKLSGGLSNGNAIYLNNGGKYNEIYDNTFSNCGGNNHYVIYCTGEGIDFYENRINFDDPSKSCGCIEIICSKNSELNHHIHDVHFHDCHVGGNSRGIVHYVCNSCSANSKLIIENNIFEKNKGKFAAFNIEAINALSITFENNSIQNNDPGLGLYLCGFDFKGSYTNDGKASTMINNRFINNTCSSPFGGGIGLWIQNKEGATPKKENIFKFQFIDCLFEGNRANFAPNSNSALGVNGKGGAVQIGYSATTAITSPFFIGCTFLRNKAENGGGALSISVAANVEIDYCVFSDNTASVKPNDKDKSPYGGAICYQPDDFLGGFPKSGQYAIYNSTFRSNNANKAHAICVGPALSTKVIIDTNCQFIDNGKTDNTIVSEASNFIVQNSFFRNEDPTLSSRSIEVKLGNADITNVSFSIVNHNDQNNHPGTTIYLFDGSTANIKSCIFSDCGTLPAFDTSVYIIYVDSTNANIIDSTFNFTDSAQSCGGICIRHYGRYSIMNNKFIRVGGYSAIRYNGESDKTDVADDVNIEGNTFDSIKNQRRAAALRGVTNNVRFNDNTIKNMADALYIVEIYLKSLSKYAFSYNTFSNLNCSSRHGGGAGLWIQNTNNQKIDLLIEECTFENSIARYTEELNGFGGGLQIGHTGSTANINLEMNNCIFRGNKAHKSGGALSIGAQHSYTITNCVFENNVGGTQSNEANKYYGGAVHIDPITNGNKPDTITFSKCTFRNNTAPDANALYAVGMSNTEIIIQKDTIFEDNCEKNKQSNVSAIIIDSNILSIDSCTFTHTNIASSSRAIEAYSITTKITNTLFEKCANQIATLPNAVWINEKVLSCQIENCNFINNGNVRGDVIRTETRDFLFDNSTIEFSDKVASTRGMYVPYYCKLSIFNSSFIKCVFNSESHSCAALEYHGEASTKPGYTEEIRIEGSTFDSNHGAQTSHAILYRIKTYPILYNITFKGSIRGKYTLTIFFDFLPKEEFHVENIVFENNYFTNLDGGGSGVWIAQYNPAQTARDTWPLTFDKCTFRSNHATQSGGAIAYGNSNTLTFISLSFNDCKFIDNLCDSTGTTSPGGGALWFNSQEPVNIRNCIFSGNEATESSTRAAGAVGFGHAIYAAPRSFISVENCKFIDNGADGLESVIQMSGQQFNLTGCEISYTEVGKSCRGIYIDFPGIINIVNTKLINCGKNNNVPQEGGGILYKANSDSVLEEQITIQGCTFDNCRAKNGCAMLFHASIPPVLQGNKVINQQTGMYVISIFYTTFQDYSIVENMNFIGGRGGSEDGGASGIWIANNRDISNGRPAELIFRGCRWEDNYSPFKGGALHYGNSPTLIGTELTFENCKFINNRAAEAGGAISIATISPSIFRNCEFNGNIVEKKTSSSTTKGAAIYIDSETPLCLISGCTFTNSSADEGNAIYASTKVFALHIQDNTKISNCGSSGSCITVESREFFFLNSQIAFDNINKASRGILIKTRTVIRISDSKFVKCSYCTAYPDDVNRQGQGGAILIQRNKVETDTQEDVQLLYSTFDACKSDNGCSIMFWVETNPTIRGNTITNHNYNKYIFTIIRGTNFADQFTIENCSFVKNKFSNKLKQDGGGAAIWVANQQFFNEGELSQLLFKDCNWTKNTGVYGGAFSYGTSNTVKFIQLEFQNCHFENNQATGDQGGALHLTTAVPVKIQGCTFYNNKCVNNIQNFGGDQAFGGAIFFDTNATDVSILNTTFRKNSAQNGNAIFVSQKTPYVDMKDTHFLSNSNGNVGAQVAHQGVELRTENCNFDYQVVTLHSKGVDILSKSITTFFNCNFTLCETPYDKGGALFVQDQLNSPNNEKLTLDGCIFDNCNSSEGAAIYASLSSSPDIKGCTIKNNVQGCSIFILTFTSKIPQIKIENCTFQNNEYLNTEENPDCGGSGIWISNVYSVEFNRCYFINNKADYAGGALAYGHDNELAEISLIFSSCFFEENKCNGKYGGALYLVNSQANIKDCTFRGNKPLGSNEIKGGDIYVDAKSGEISISNSHFESSTTQINEGNAIYCSSNTDKLSISNTDFNDCGISGTVITSYAKDNSITVTNVKFTEAANEKSARGLALYLIPESKTMIQDCHFINCYFNTQDNNNGGGGLYVKFNGETEMPQENFIFDGCQFIGTVSNIGAAIYLDLYSQISLKGVTISNCESNNNILYIKYANQAEVTTLEDCRFTNNKLTSSADGGGSGILIPQTQKISFSVCTFINNSATGSGGAFAYYNNQESKNTELEFNGCTFNGNIARSNGGALYLVTNQPISITRCIFESNTANGNSGALYIDSKANIKLELLNIARNKASSKNAALYVNNAQTLEFINNTISDNTCPSSPSSVEINNDGTANIAENKFDFNRQSDSQYQIAITGSSSSAICNLDKNCFTHKGEVTNNNLVHVLSSHAGQINVPAGNCFDSGQYNSLQHNGGPSSVGENIFNCQKCGEIYIPTPAPEATPTATRQMTSKPTDVPVPTDVPYIPTPVATPHPTGDSGVTSISASVSASSNVPGGDQSNKGKKKKVNIGMIAGIAAAAVVVIVVVIILLWLFVFRRRRNNNSPQGTMNSAPQGTDETISGVSGVNTTPQDDPIWAGATATHDNPLFNGSDDQDEDQMHTGFEESWGENVI